ncbi:secretion protein MttC [Spirochaetia bacterium]|nr:secretion protein MttC [Spirochaetia bacterium]
MALIDIGINLMNRAFDAHREAIVARAAKAGVSPLVITGANLQSSQRALDYARTFPQKAALFTTAGVHPHDAKTFDNGPAGTIASLRALASSVLVLAIGECGLDYNRDFSPRTQQRFCFAQQLLLAAELGLPVFLHERDAFADFSAMLTNVQGTLKAACVHCFTGTAAQLDAYLALGCYIGITGWVCDERRGKHLIPLLKKIPADKLLLETDAPFLLPRTMEQKDTNGRRNNEPAFLPHIARFIAEALEKDIEQLATETFANTLNFFPRLNQALIRA